MKVELIFSGAEPSMRIQAENEQDKALLSAFSVQSGALFRVDKVTEHDRWTSHSSSALVLYRQPPQPPDDRERIEPAELKRLREVERCAALVSDAVASASETTPQSLIGQMRRALEGWA